MDRDPRLSRRQLLGGLTGAAIAAGLAACLPSGSASPAPTAGPTSPPTPSGTTPGSSATPTGVPTPPPSTDPAALRRKIGRMLLVGFRGLEIRPDDAITGALEAGLGGVILFDRDQTTGGSRNIESPQQLAKLTASLRAAAASGPLLIAVDQEGGRVSRLNPAQGFPATKTQAAVGATGDPDVALAVGRAMGATMATAGIDFDLAPVVDVNVDPGNPAIGALDRSFSADPGVVAAMAEAEIRGLHQRGIRSAIKHFPGLGSATANTDFAASVDVTNTWTEAELEPYETLIGLGLADAVMSAHILNRHLDPKLPASLSPAVVDGLLRRRLGWTGAVMTDDLGAAAITSHYQRAEAIALAIEAGNDLLTFANQATYVDDLARRVVAAIVAHVESGRITEARIDESIARLDRLVAGPG